jgi:hypothetical protein
LPRSRLNDPASPADARPVLFLVQIPHVPGTGCSYLCLAGPLYPRAPLQPLPCAHSTAPRARPRSSTLMALKAAPAAPQALCAIPHGSLDAPCSCFVSLLKAFHPRFGAGNVSRPPSLLPPARPSRLDSAAAGAAASAHGTHCPPIMAFAPLARAPAAQLVSRMTFRVLVHQSRPSPPLLSDSCSLRQAVQVRVSAPALPAVLPGSGPTDLHSDGKNGYVPWHVTKTKDMGTREKLKTILFAKESFQVNSAPDSDWISGGIIRSS